MNRPRFAAAALAACLLMTAHGVRAAPIPTYPNSQAGIVQALSDAEAAMAAVQAEVGPITGSPAANTLQARMVTLATSMATLHADLQALGTSGLATASGQATEQSDINAVASAVTALQAQIGEVQASPTANTVLDRLKQAEAKLDTLHNDLQALGTTGLSTAAKQDAQTSDLDAIKTATQAGATASGQSTQHTDLTTLHTDMSTTLHVDLATTLHGDLAQLHTDMTAQGTGALATAARQDAQTSDLDAIKTATQAGATASGQTTAHTDAAQVHTDLTTDPSIVTGTITALDAATTTVVGQYGVNQVSGTPTTNSAVSASLVRVPGVTVIFGCASTAGACNAGTAVIETQGNGGPWQNTGGKVAGSSQRTSAITGPGTWNVPTAQKTGIRVRATACTSCSFSVTLAPSYAPGPVDVENPVSVVDNSSGSQQSISGGYASVDAKSTNGIGVSGFDAIGLNPSHNPMWCGGTSTGDQTAPLAGCKIDPTSGGLVVFLANGYGSTDATNLAGVKGDLDSLVGNEGLPIPGCGVNCAAIGYVGMQGYQGSWSNLIVCNQQAHLDSASSGEHELVAAVSGKVIYVCGYKIISGGVVSGSTTNAVNLAQGTSGTCGGTVTALTNAFPLSVSIPVVADLSAVWHGLATGSSDDLCFNLGSAVDTGVDVYFGQF